MLAKVIAHGADRREALARLTAALDETVVLGLTTNLRFLRWLVRRPEVVRGEARIDTLDAIWPPSATARGRDRRSRTPAWAEAARLLGAGGWRLNGPARARLVADDGTERSVAVAAGAGRAGRSPRSATATPSTSTSPVGRVAFRVAPPPDVDRAARAAAARTPTAAARPSVVAPMPGAVLAVHVAVGDAVEAGDPIVTLEAMKMEHVVAAPGPGRVAELARPRRRPGRPRPGARDDRLERRRASRTRYALRHRRTDGQGQEEDRDATRQGRQRDGRPGTRRRPAAAGGQHHAAKAHGRPPGRHEPAGDARRS